MEDVIKYGCAALLGVAACILVVGLVATADASGIARDCDKMGMTMLNGKPYVCHALQEKQP